MLEDFYNNGLSEFGLSLGTFSLRDIILRIKESGYSIWSVLGKEYEDNVGFEVFESYEKLEKDEFTNKYLCELLFEFSYMEDNYREIFKKLDDEYTIVSFDLNHDIGENATLYLRVSVINGSKKLLAINMAKKKT